MLLSRVADNLFWGARYLERAEDTARLVRSFTDLVIDLPIGPTSAWEPLITVAGNRSEFETAFASTLALPGATVREADVVRFLVADTANPGSVLASVARARENLRTTREVLPRDAWQTVNDLYLYSVGNGEAGVERRSRARFLTRVVADCQRLDGVMSASMSRDEAYEMWRLGQAIERADMTTRVVGVRAAALLAQTPDDDDHDEVQWMGLLRSLTALQMYQRATRGPIDGASAVRFLLLDDKFPRSVASCVKRIRLSLERLPKSDLTLPAVDELDALLPGLSADADDGASLDTAMDRVQQALAHVNDRAASVFVRGEAPVEPAVRIG
jgi:uncharacterized alpha-E superfamily protein